MNSLPARWPVVALLAWATAAVLHAPLRAASPPAEAAPTLRPEPAAWRAMALGHDRAAASLLWMRTGIVFARSDPASAPWIREATLTCMELDPAWRAPARYGALMLAALGSIDDHEQVLRHAAATWPDDPWFPTALAMSRYLHRGDLQGAATWLEWAATTPGATAIHDRAATTFRRRAEEAL